LTLENGCFLILSQKQHQVLIWPMTEADEQRYAHDVVTTHLANFMDFYWL